MNHHQESQTQKDVRRNSHSEEDQDNSSSEFSLSKTKKIMRNVKRKKTTKLIHNICIVRKLPNGEKQLRYVQQTSQTTLKGQEDIKRLALKQCEENRASLAPQVLTNAGNPESQQSPQMMSVPEQQFCWGWQAPQLPQYFYLY